MKINSKDILYLTLGIILCSVGYTFFLVPGKISTGGIAGISMVLHHLFKTPFGIVLIVLNIPLLIISIKMFGTLFVIRTLVSILLIGFLSDLLGYFKFLIFEGNQLLATLYGGVILGIGLGFIFKGKGSTGGSDIIGRLINRYTSISIGTSIFIVDSIVIGLTGIVFKSYELILYSYLSLYLSSKMIDLVLEGQDYAKGVFIFTNKPEKISDEIMNKLKRGVSGFEGKGMYSKENKTILYCVVARRELSILSKIIEEIDRDAFVVVENVYEVMGKGFPRR
uniref:YitT family protein n=1 Tax=candidate division WOR-3 bacterium TaxID=2052148 RepID=A0A7C3NDE0_UNCW3